MTDLTDESVKSLLHKLARNFDDYQAAKFPRYRWDAGPQENDETRRLLAERFDILDELRTRR